MLVEFVVFTVFTVFTVFSVSCRQKTMSSALTKRKKESADADKDPDHDPEAANNAIVAKKRDSKNNVDVLDRVIKCLCITAILLSLALIAVPSHLKARRNKIINEQFQIAVKTVEDQRKFLTQKYKQLTSTIADEEIQRHKIEIDNLKSDSALKQASIDKLNELISKQTAELQRVQKLMQEMKDDETNFCSGCDFYLGATTRMKCGDRVNFMVKKYKKNEDDTKEALTKEYPDCKKKKK